MGAHFPLVKVAQTNDPTITGPMQNQAIEATQVVKRRGPVAEVRPANGKADPKSAPQTGRSQVQRHPAPGAARAFKGAESLAGAVLPEIPTVPYQAVTHPIKVTKGLYHDALAHLKAPELLQNPVHSLEGHP
jgi:hypothetical protein